MKPSLRPDGQAGDDRALNDGMGIVQENQVVLAGARFAFIAIDQHVLRLGALLGNE